MGSIPIYTSKLLLFSFIIELIALIMVLFVDIENIWFLLILGPIYYALIYMKYRNKNARHRHELETKKRIFNLKKSDNFVKIERGLSNSFIRGKNNTVVNG